MFFRPVQENWTMKKMVLFLTVCALLLLMPSCRTGDEPPEETPILGEIYDTGQFQILVPASWRVFPITDPLDPDRPVKTNCVFLRKGRESDWHIFEKPYIRMECYSKEEQIETQIPEEDLAHDPQTIAPMELGNLVWQGYCADSYQGRARVGRFAVLWAEDHVYRYQVLVWFESGGESVRLEDRDLQAILASLSPSDRVN